MVMRNEYYFLSNMYPCSVKMQMGGKDLVFPCAESAFQAAKCPEHADAFAGEGAPDGYAAKKMGRRVQLRSDWESVKIAVMADVLAAKFSQNHDLMEKLSKVSGPIVEDNTWGDAFWGRSHGAGKNWLGRLLEQVRDFPVAKGYGPKDWLKNLGVN